MVEAAPGLRPYRWPSLGLLLVLGLGACVHSGAPRLSENAAATEPFNLCNPPCPPAERPAARDGAIDIRYLGVSGLYVDWSGHAFLTSPFFSRPSLGRVTFAHVKANRTAIQEGLEGLPLDKVMAILVGHGHYDHLGDVPVVAMDYAKDARLFTNRTSTYQLAAYPEVEARTIDLEESLGDWVTILDRSGDPLPLRVMPLPSTHACMTKKLRWAGGSAKGPWTTPWNRRHYVRLKQGQALALLIDLLHPDGTVAFRIYYQEAASHGGTGEVPQEVLRQHGVDLAVLTTASHYLARDYPESLLEHLQPRHILATHYEDFFRRPSKPARLTPLLTSKRASAFLQKLSATPLPAGGFRGPRNDTCGPSNGVYTLPLYKEWMQFDANPPGGAP